MKEHLPTRLKKSTVLALAMITTATVILGVLILQAGTGVLLILILLVGVLSVYVLSRLLILRINRLERLINEKQKQLVLVSDEKFQRMEEFIALNGMLNPQYPLPTLTKSAVSPALANILVRTIGTHKPKVIVECGSGVSTLIVCYCLSRNGSGHVYSLDHMVEYAQITKDTLHEHHLSGYGTVYVADLVSIDIDGRQFIWYNPEVLHDITEIDLLIVDGPPGHLNKMARYPAIPILLNKLKNGAIVLVDDYDRPDEKAMVREWCGQYGFTIIAEYDVEKGACALRKSSATG